MIISVAKPKELKEGDFIITDYGLQSRFKVYLSEVRRVIDNGKAVIVGDGGHAHKVPFADILVQVVGKGKEANENSSYIIMRETLDEVMANGGGAILAETFTEWYNRMCNRKEV